jgi:hypothetical protein
MLRTGFAYVIIIVTHALNKNIPLPANVLGLEKSE